MTDLANSSQQRLDGSPVEVNAQILEYVKQHLPTVLADYMRNHGSSALSSDGDSSDGGYANPGTGNGKGKVKTLKAFKDDQALVKEARV